MQFTMKWKHQQRKEFINRCAIVARLDWEKMVKFMEERPNMTGRASFDLSGIMDCYIEEYAYQIEWCGERQWNKAKVDILNSAYSDAERAERWSDKDYTEFKKIVAEKLAELS